MNLGEIGEKTFFRQQHELMDFYFLRCVKLNTVFERVSQKVIINESIENLYVELRNNLISRYATIQNRLHSTPLGVCKFYCRLFFLSGAKNFMANDL